MKIKQIKFIQEDDTEVVICIPDHFDVIILQNMQARNFIGMTESSFPKSYSTIIIAPKGTNTKIISDAIDSVIN